MMLTTRVPLPEECDAITALCLRSKAYWGYDDEFMATCRWELEVTPANLAGHFCRFAVDIDMIVGFVEISVEGDTAEVEKLFIDTDAMGKGVGRVLFELGRDHASKAGASRMTIAADPGAEPFYARMGATTVGAIASGSIEGRTLPLMELALS